MHTKPNSNIYKKFIDIPFGNFLSLWHRYYHCNYHSFQQQIECLKDGLDGISITVVDNFIERIIKKIPVPSEHYLIRENYLYTQDDIRVIKKESLTKSESKNFRKYYKITKEFPLQVSVFRYHNGVKHLPREVIKSLENKVFIDCGSYYGDSSLVLNKYKPSKLISIEPCSVNFRHLECLVNNNNLESKFVLLNKAVGARKGKALVEYNSNSRPNLGAKTHFHVARDVNSIVGKKKNEIIEVITIDSLFNLKEYIPKVNNSVGLIKIDIEGAELEAIIGAKEVIKYYKPVLLIAIYHNAEEFFNIKRILQHFNPEYKFLIRALDSEDTLYELYLICY